VIGSTVVQKEIWFTARHNFKDIRGVCEEIRTEALELQINKNSIQLKSPFSIIIPVISMKTGNASRDSHMLESLEYPKFKEIKGRINSISGSDSSILIKGSLEIRGKEKSFETKAALKNINGKKELTGSFMILLSDFAIDPPDLLFMKVKDEVRIDYRIVIE